MNWIINECLIKINKIIRISWSDLNILIKGFLNLTFTEKDGFSLDMHFFFSFNNIRSIFSQWYYLNCDMTDKWLK